MSQAVRIERRRCRIRNSCVDEGEMKLKLLTIEFANKRDRQKLDTKFSADVVLAWKWLRYRLLSERKFGRGGILR